MTDQQQHPITPPPELVEQWRYAASNVPASRDTDTGERCDYIDYIATQAARWGAEEALHHICGWLDRPEIGGAHLIHPLLCCFNTELLNPKPPNLKVHALAVLNDASSRLDAAHENAIRRALEALPDD